MKIYEILEITMLLCFGFAWPFNVIKSIKARTAKGKSLLFLVLVLIGYIAGITAKYMSPSYKWYVLFFYYLNFVMVFTDFLLYFRNKRLDRLAQK
ncbi:MAG: hypothetical protein PHO44_03405 [Sphaerochaetaceae bacterium]|jgi:uncharacterized membrane protein|nr:hypothetical protein [Sphaerochaetaceae bacterium]MDD3162787.1 hypothetical protein [Sphaerochaetaceae bacterium]MDD4007006.1 hypothetical protein [Sphaerochaetaceae bacterium]MDD4396291.1 hypothetical protein [Sphaerochaetaceae bacterium]